MTEPFSQWVIEDHFPRGRPRWEDAGAQMTQDVAPYEKMKMSLLNASHDDAGQPLPVTDSLSEPLGEAARSGGADPAALLGFRAVFSEDLASQPAFVAELRGVLASFREHGVAATLARYTV